jgi:hypothetical protein
MMIQSICNILSNERIGPSYAIATGPRQHSHSQISVPRVSWPYFTVSVSRLPKPGGPGARIYNPVIPLGTGFPLRRLLQLARIQWRYSAPPPTDHVAQKTCFKTGCWWKYLNIGGMESYDARENCISRNKTCTLRHIFRQWSSQRGWDVQEQWQLFHQTTSNTTNTALLVKGYLTVKKCLSFLSVRGT